VRPLIPLMEKRSLISHIEYTTAWLRAKRLNGAAKRWAALPRSWRHSRITRDRAALTLTISRALPHAAATRRCLLTLEELGYVTRSGRQFLLRPKVLELGAAYLESMNIELLTKTHLEELARNTGDSAALCVRRHRNLYVARPRSARCCDWKPRRQPLSAHATSTGGFARS